MPTDSLTRSSGTARADPAAEACVIRPGSSISDSTPPSDSARVNSLVRAHTVAAPPPPPPLRPAPHREPPHPAEPAHLLRRQLVTGMRRQPRVQDLTDRR